MIWKPPKGLGLGFALLGLAVLVAAGLFTVRSLVGQEVDLGLFWRMLWLICDASLLVVVICWAVELYGLRYELDRDALTIHSSTHRRIVPMEKIERLMPASGFPALGALRSFRWPGYRRGTIHIEGLGDVRVYATTPLDKQFIAITDDGGYAISPRDRQGFLRDYAIRQSLGPLHSVAERVEYGPVTRWPVWHDVPFWAISAAGLLVCLILSGALLKRYPGLPDRISFRMLSQGGVKRITSKQRLLAMPELGAITLAVDTFLGILLHREERLGAYLLILVALGVQVVFTLALVSIL